MTVKPRLLNCTEKTAVSSGNGSVFVGQNNGKGRKKNCLILTQKYCFNNMSRAKLTLDIGRKWISKVSGFFVKLTSETRRFVVARVRFL